MEKITETIFQDAPTVETQFRESIPNTDWGVDYARIDDVFIYRLTNPMTDTAWKIGTLGEVGKAVIKQAENYKAWINSRYTT